MKIHFFFFIILFLELVETKFKINQVENQTCQIKTPLEIITKNKLNYIYLSTNSLCDFNTDINNNLFSSNLKTYDKILEINNKESSSINLFNFFYAKACVTYNDKIFILIFNIINPFENLLIDLELLSNEILTQCSIMKLDNNDLAISYIISGSFIIKYYSIKKFKENENDLTFTYEYFKENIESNSKSSLNFLCSFSKYFKNIFCASGFEKDIDFYIFHEYQKINSLKFQIKSDKNIIYTLLTNYNEKIFFTISLLEINLLENGYFEIDKFKVSYSSLLFQSHLELSFSKLDIAEIPNIQFGKLNEKSILIYIYNNKNQTPTLHFKNTIYLIDVNTMYYIEITKKFSFEIPNHFNYEQLICSSEIFEIFILYSNDNEDSNNKKMLFLYFKRPSCINYSKKLNINSSLNIGLNDLSNDENVKLYKIKTIPKQIKGTLEFYNTYCQDLSNNCEKEFNEGIKYISPNEVTTDLIYFFLIQEDPFDNMDSDNFKIINFDDDIFYTSSDLCKIEINVYNCYKLCNSCNKVGDINSHNCLTCKDNYIISNGNCILFDDFINILTYEKSIYIEQMKENEIIENYKYFKNIEIGQSGFIEIKSEECIFSKYLSTIKIISETKTPQIDLGNCKNNLQLISGISDNEPIIINQITYNKSFFPVLKFEIYDNNKNKLDLNNCINDTINEIYPINSKNEEEMNLELYKNILEKQNCSIYDPNSKIYNDICVRYSYRGKDLTLKNRREFLFKNLTFCSEGCNLKEIDLKNKVIICECSGKILLNKNLKLDNNINYNKLGGFPEEINENYFKIFKCYNILMKDIGHNFSFFVVFFGIIIQIICLIIFNSKRYIVFSPPLKDKDSNYILNNENNIIYKHHIYIPYFGENDFENLILNKKKDSNKNEDIIELSDQIENDDENKNNVKKYIYSKKKGRTYVHISQKLKNKETIEPKREYIENNIEPKTINLPIKKRNLNNENFVILNHLNSSRDFIKKNQNNSVDNNSFMVNNNINEEISFEELNELEYFEAITEDNRSFLKCYKDYFIGKQFFFKICLSKSLVYTIQLKIINLIFHIHTFIFVNAFLFNDYYIGERFIRRNENFWYFIVKEFPKCFYSSLFSFLICKISLLFTSSEGKLRRYIRKVNIKLNDFEIKDIITELLTYMKQKRFIWFILIFILGIFYFYYLYIFCFLYKYTQLFLIINTLISFCLNIVYICFISLLIVVFRISGLKCKKWILFKISEIMYYIL